MYESVERMWHSFKLFVELLLIQPCLKHVVVFSCTKEILELPRSTLKGGEGPSSAASDGARICVVITSPKMSQRLLYLYKL